MLTPTTLGSAVAPPNVHIEVPEVIGVNGDPFTASGDAVGAGLICAPGSVDNLNVAVSEHGAGALLIVHAHRRFTCDDLSRRFDVKMTVQLDQSTNNTTANWRIVDGTGAYLGIRGSGSLAGTPIDGRLRLLRL